MLHKSASRSVIAVALAVALAGCSQTTSGQGNGAAASSTSATGGFPSTSEAAATLSKAEFISRMNLVCSGVVTTLGKSVPSSDTDYPALRNFFTATLGLFQAYITQAKQLAAQTADNAELTEKWIAVEEADFNRAKPVVSQLIAAADAKDSAKIDQLESQLNSLPDHSDAIASFMTGYGLTDCAQLETG